LVAEAKRGQEQVAVRLLTAAAAAGLVRRSLDPEPVARRLIATADGLAMRVLTGELPAAEALELLEGDLTALGGRRRPAGGGGRRATPRPPA
jgi:hypothetical protein